jgi:hypothetical protein
MHKHDNCFAERRKNMKSLKLNIFAVFLLLLAPFSIVFANHGDDDEATADPFELVLGNDGVSSLPVFKGPFPETENMRFLSQIDPEDLGALEVPGVWAKGMMNDIGGWTSPNGEEYALATNSGGIAIVRVSLILKILSFWAGLRARIPSTSGTSGAIPPPSATMPTLRPRSTTLASSL